VCSEPLTRDRGGGGVTHWRVACVMPPLTQRYVRVSSLRWRGDSVPAALPRRELLRRCNRVFSHAMPARSSSPRDRGLKVGSAL
jgi:hypothetical protein